MSTRRRRHEPAPPAGPAPWAPGSPGVLLVLAGKEEETGSWGALVAELAQVLGLEVAFETGRPGDRSDPGWVDAVVQRAAEAEGPVLVMPARAAGGAGPTKLADGTLGRVLAPFDATDEVSSSIVPVLQRLQDAGVDVAQLHVTSSASVPGMWEGSGHHALAWHAELRRRHQVGSATVEVTGGAPGVAVAARTAEADLVLLCWTRSVTSGRSQTVRAVLRAVNVPVMLLARC